MRNGSRRIGPGSSALVAACSNACTAQGRHSGYPQGRGYPDAKDSADAPYGPAAPPDFTALAIRSQLQTCTRSTTAVIELFAFWGVGVV